MLQKISVRSSMEFTPCIPGRSASFVFWPFAQTEISVCFDLVRPRVIFRPKPLVPFYDQRDFDATTDTHTPPQESGMEKKKQLRVFSSVLCFFLSELIFSKCQILHMMCKKMNIMLESLWKLSFSSAKDFFVRNLCIFFPVRPRIVVQKRLSVCSHICKVLKFILL